MTTHQKFTTFILLLTSFLLMSCKGVQVEKGVLRDTIFSVEDMYNGSTRVWMTHDDIAGYCTLDPQIGQMAHELLAEHDGEVILEFQWVISGEERSFWHRSDCGEVSSGGGSTEMFRIIDIYPVRSR